VPIGYPTQVRAYTSEVDLVSTVNASDVNSLQQEIVAIETALGTAASTSPLISTYGGTWSTTTTNWTTLGDRLLNIEAGLVNGLPAASSPYVSKSGGSTISVSTSTAAPGLTLVTTSGTNNLITASSFTVNYQGIPQVSGANVLYVGSSEYTAIYSAITSSSSSAASKLPLSTVTTNGDLIYGTGSSTVGRLGIGSSGQYLTVVGGIPAWSTIPSYLSGTTLTTAGDLLTYTSGATRLPVGSNGQVLTVVSGAPAWATPNTAYVASSNGSVSAASTSSGVVRNVWTSTSAPSSGNGADGDIWLVYV